MTPPKKKAAPRPWRVAAVAATQADGGLTEAEQARVMELAGAELLAVVLGDPKILALSKRYPDETTRLFLAGCRAGVAATAATLQGRLAS